MIIEIGVAVKMLKQTFDYARYILEKDPAAKTIWEVIFLYPGFKAMRMYRRANWFYTRGHTFIARWISQRCVRKTGIEIHPGATIGKNLFIDHGTGIVIGETAVIGDNCIIYQGVTLGGTGLHKCKRHPTIGNNVLIGAHCTVLGNIKVGDNARIGAGAIVLVDIPAGATVVGCPTPKIIDKKQKA